MLTKSQVKPMFFADQMITSTYASTKLSQVRNTAKEHPLFITSTGSGVPDTVIMSYEHYEKIYATMLHLADKVDELSATNLGKSMVELATEVVREASTPDRTAIIKKAK